MAILKKVAEQTHQTKKALALTSLFRAGLERFTELEASSKQISAAVEDYLQEKKVSVDQLDTINVEFFLDP